jgi:hypothetical protein
VELFFEWLLEIVIFLVAIDKIQYKVIHERSFFEGIFAIILTNACKAKGIFAFSIENCWTMCAMIM